MTRFIVDKVRKIPVASKYVVLAGVVGAIVPDLDMFYFYLIDNRQTHHHKYISHWPILWLAALTVSYLLCRYAKDKKIPFLAVVFGLGGMLHIVLDSVVGDIWWFAPLLDEPYSMFTVPARFHPWWLSFILHWSFVMELVILGWAAVLYRNRSNK